MSNWLTEAEAREILVRKVHELGTQEQIAAEAGCSTALVSHAMNGQKPVGKKLGTYLGLIAQPVRTFQYLRTR